MGSKRLHWEKKFLYFVFRETTIFRVTFLPFSFLDHMLNPPKAPGWSQTTDNKLMGALHASAKVTGSEIDTWPELEQYH